jgi:hypothetical protein
MSDKNQPQTFDNPNQTDQDINILDLNIIVDKLLNLILEKINEGKEEKMIKRYVFNYINNYQIILQ